MPLSNSDLNIINLRNQAVPNRRYYGNDGRVYIGTKEGRLRLENSATEVTFSETSSIDASNVQDAIENLSNNDATNAQNAVGSILTDTTTIGLTYDSSTPQIYADLLNTAVTAGTYGSATQVPQFVVDANGRLTSAINVAIAITPGSIALTQNNILVGSAANIATDVSMSGEASIISTGAVTLSNSAVIGKLLTGYTSGAGTITASDSILSAIQKLNGNVSALVTGVSSVSGTANRISTSPTTGAVVVDIAATYIGQTSITTLGTITAGTWNGTAIANANLANSAITINGAATSLGGAVTITTTGVLDRTTVTLGGGLTPTVDIAATYVGQTSITTLGTITTGTWNGTTISNAYLANSSITIGSTNISLGTTSLTLSGLTSLGIGTSTPATLLHVLKNTNGEASIYVDNQSGGTAETSAIYANGSGGGYSQLVHFGSAYTTNGLIAPNLTWLSGSDNVMVGTRVAGKDLIFHTAGFAAGNERMRILANGNVGIGTASPSGIFHVVQNTTQAVFEGGTQGSISIKKTGQTAFNIYTGLTGFLGFYPGSGSINNFLIAGGNVGVGYSTSSTTIGYNLGFANQSARTIGIESSATDVIGRRLTINAGSTVAGTSVSNIAGGDVVINSGLGTGTGTSDIFFQTGTTLTTGTTLQTLSTKMKIQGNGNVGIGTNSPAYKLDVNGTANFSGNLNITNAHIKSVQTTAPGIVLTTGNGITATAITAGSTDIKGKITTTGTNNATAFTLITVTYNVAYDVVPVVVVSSTTTPSGTGGFRIHVVLTTTGFGLYILNTGTAIADPSFNYVVIE